MQPRTLRSGIPAKPKSFDGFGYRLSRRKRKRWTEPVFKVTKESEKFWVFFIGCFQFWLYDRQPPKKRLLVFRTTIRMFRLPVSRSLRKSGRNGLFESWRVSKESAETMLWRQGKIQKKPTRCAWQEAIGIEYQPEEETL